MPKTINARVLGVDLHWEPNIRRDSHEELSGRIKVSYKCPSCKETNYGDIEIPPEKRQTQYYCAGNKCKEVYSLKFTFADVRFHLREGLKNMLSSGFRVSAYSIKGKK